jgi:hypothetical protein
VTSSATGRLEVSTRNEDMVVLLFDLALLAVYPGDVQAGPTKTCEAAKARSMIRKQGLLALMLLPVFASAKSAAPYQLHVSAMSAPCQLHLSSISASSRSAPSTFGVASCYTDECHLSAISASVQLQSRSAPSATSGVSSCYSEYSGTLYTSSYLVQLYS